MHPACYEEYKEEITVFEIRLLSGRWKKKCIRNSPGPSKLFRRH
jgi:hypothetical protein